MDIFLHIPKCGGFSITQYFDYYFENNLAVKLNGNILPEDFPGYDKIIEHDCITGHLPYSRLMENGNYDWSKVDCHSIIRDPIDRLISLYNYILSSRHHPQNIAIQRESPLEYIERIPGNTQARFLGVPAYFDSIDDMMNVINCVAIEDCEDYFAEYFSKKFPEISKPSFRRLNVTRDTFQPPDGKKFVSREDIPSKVMGALTKKHSLDYELYMAARAMKKQ